MAGGFKVTPEELKSGAGKLLQTAGHIGTELSNAKAEVTRLTGPWEGEAMRKFDDLMRKWDELARAQADNLDQISKTLDQAADAYAETESSVSRAFNV